MSKGSARGRWGQGSIEELPSGALRVRVLVGRDPVRQTSRYFLTETVPAGPNARRDAEKVRTRLRNQVDEQRNPRTRATVGELLDRWLKVLDVEASTRRSYQAKVDKHVRPFLGNVAAGQVDAEALESLYAELRRCRAHCDRRGDTHPGSDCRPLSDASIRAVHICLSGAYKRAIKWGWLHSDPTKLADKPALPKPEPKPPTPDEAARLVTAAWRADPDWGTFVWLAMTTGARRGELSALTWADLDLDGGVVFIRHALHQDENGQIRHKDTKTHQQRRVVLEAPDLKILKEHLARAQQRAAQFSAELLPSAYVFSIDPGGLTPPRPDTATQRYNRLAKRLGIKTSLKQLRNYSATELISSGVDVRTVAGRLGHGGGGATTLRVYAAWLSEADQRAAKTLSGRVPRAPVTADTDAEVRRPRQPGMAGTPPHEQIVSDLRGAINCGALAPGAELPTVKDLAKRYDVVPSTAHRAIAQLAGEHLIKVSRGRRATVT